jgi:carboxylesterase type B
MLNPQRLPIRKCILESGSPTARTILHAAHARTAANVAALKSNLTPQMASKPLHSLKVDGILDAAVLVWAQHMNALTWPFQPVIDGDGGVVTDLPLKLWEGKTFGTGEGELAAVMTGFCSHEGADFIPKRPAPFSKFFSTLIPNLTSSDIQALEALYPESGYTSQAQRLGEAYGHFAYICPVLHTAHAASQKPGAKVYLYEFAALTSAATRSAAHASHGETLTRAVSTKWPGLRGVSQAMHQRWTSFIASPDGIVSNNNNEAGDAASTENTVWPAFETPFGEGATGKGELLVFGDGNDEMIGGRNQGTPVKTRVLTEREKEVCRFWWDRMELSQGNGQKGVVKKTW